MNVANSGISAAHLYAQNQKPCLMHSPPPFYEDHTVYFSWIDRMVSHEGIAEGH